MSKTKKQKKSPDTSEQSTQPKETVITIEKPSKSSTGESEGASAEDLKCPVCDSDYSTFKLDDASKQVYCGACGINTRGYERSPYWGPIVKAWLKKYGPALPNMPEGTPVCEAKSYTKDGVELTCGGQTWKHDGNKLLYCGKCGSNFRGAQPKNVDAIIATMGKQLVDRSGGIPRPFKNVDIQKIQEAARRGVEK